MKLLAGERKRIEGTDSLLLVRSGEAEVYAVSEEESRRLYLMTAAAGDAAFPSLDEFEEIAVEIYATKDSECSELRMADMDAATLLPLMRRWFAALVELPWLRLMADRGDDVLKSWEDGSVLSAYEAEVAKTEVTPASAPVQPGTSPDAAGLIEAFAENEGIFAMLVGVRFTAQDEKLAMRTVSRGKQKRRLVDETIAHLLGEDSISVEENAQGGARFNEAVSLVRAAAQALHMPSAEIRLAPEMVKRLDREALLRRLAARGGMGMRLVRLEPGWSQSDSGVMIGFYQPEGATKDTLAAFLPDSPTGYRMVTQEQTAGVPMTAEMESHVAGIAYLLYAGLPAKKLTRLDILSFIFRQCWKEDWHRILSTSLLLGLIPLIMPIVTETIFKDILPILDRKGLAAVAQVAFVSGFTTAALATVRSVALMRISVAGGTAGMAALVGRLLSFPSTFFRRWQAGNIVHRLIGMEELTNLIAGESTGVLLSVICSFWSLLLMCYYSVKLTAAALLIWLIYTLFSTVILWRLVGAEQKMREAQNRTAGILQEIFTGLMKFRTRGAEEQAYHLWGEKFAEEWKWNYKTRQLKNYSTVVAAVEPILLSLVLYYFGVKEVAESAAGSSAQSALEALGLGGTAMTAATFIAFQAAFTAFNTSIVNVMPVLEEFSVAIPILNNLAPILEEVPEEAEEKVEADVLSGSIEVRNLTFGYREGVDILKDISFRIAAGEHVAIVGKSGCGKSTLIRLLLGFEKPKSGAVYYDGQDLAELSLTSVRSQMGVVMQNGQLMSGDILHNIIGTNNLTEADAWRAAEAAGIDEDIREMPMKMQTLVSEGSTNISGGQRQRILIARALALTPSIIICDEATSALDNRTQAIVTKSLDKLHATRIVVAHRLSTIRHADRIIVLDQGRIAESGTFDELVEKGGLFASFVHRQTV